MNGRALILYKGLAGTLARRLKARPESDRSKALKLLIDERTAPELYEGTPADSREAWLGVVRLAEEGLVKIHTNPKSRSQDPMFSSPRLEPLPGAYLALATIGGIKTERFEDEVAQELRKLGFSENACNRVAALRLTELQCVGAATAAKQLTRIPELALNRPDLFLREASAQLFNSRSKVLDHRQDLIEAVLGHPCPWAEAPVPLVVALAQEKLKEVVFVENLVTFERLKGMRQSYPEIAFIYAAGWRAAAGRAAFERGRCLYFDRAPSADERRTLLEALDPNIPATKLHFFGDLDFSGMGILSTMRTTYQSVGAWEPGYSQLLEILNTGEGHLAIDAAKENQNDPKLTGCPYADFVLLPAIRLAGRFVDQEIWAGACVKAVDSIESAPQSPDLRILAA